MKKRHILHLYNRIGFGITPKELSRLSRKSRKNIVKELFQNSKNVSEISVDTSFLNSIDPKDLRDEKFRRKVNKKVEKKLLTFQIYGLNIS